MKWWVNILPLFLMFGMPYAAAGQAKPPQNPKPGAASFRNTAPDVAYVGSESCSGCHAEIYERFRGTAMGRSMALAGESSSLERVPSPVTVFDQEQNRYFQVFCQGTDIFQSEYALDLEGQERYKQTEKIAYVMGAGSQGIAYIVQKGNYLFEAPLSFYTLPKTWALSPGYESNNLGFSRPVVEECIVCHSGLPQPVPGRYGLYGNPPFRELAVGCENCHGPGKLHVSERTRGAPLPGELDTAIVNPAKLPAWLADNICMNCHQGGDVRVLQPGKHYLDYRPGTPLDDTLAIFKVPLRRQSSPQSDLLEHNFSLRLSRCYRASGDQMRCTSCHDPHARVTKNERVEYYRKKCLGCHAETSCVLSLQDRRNQSPPDDCSGCHMPKRVVKEVEHAALANHRIIRRSDEPYPEEAFRLTTASLPDLIHVSAIPGRDPATVPALTLLQAYQTLSSSNHREYEEAYVKLLDQLAQPEPSNAIVLAALAQKAMAAETPEARSNAIGYLSRAIQLGSTSPNDYLLLGHVLSRSGRIPEAIDILRKGSALFPYVTEFYQSMAADLMSMRKYSAAVETIKKGLETFPGDATLKILLKKSERVLLPSVNSGATVP
jgi:predicted CXXCH cytochrome family protein